MNTWTCSVSRPIIRRDRRRCECRSVYGSGVFCIRPGTYYFAPNICFVAVHAIVAGAQVAQGKPEMARNRFGFPKRHEYSKEVSLARVALGQFCGLLRGMNACRPALARASYR